jgi:hypothetical protein
MKDGKNTSEHKLAKVAIITSIVLPILAAILEVVQTGGYVESPLMLALLGVAGTCLASLGYGSSRTKLKASQLEVDAQALTVLHEGTKKTKKS